jgi:hypothetical protein
VSFSVSRINRLLSDYVVVFWVFVGSYVVWKFIGSPTLPDLQSTLCAWGAVLFLIIIAIVLPWLGLLAQTSRLRGTLPNMDGSHGGPIQRRCAWSRRVSRIVYPTFLRRYAPDEGERR